MDRLGKIAGIPLYSTPTAVQQFRFPRTKNRRIRKKWAARPENFRPYPHFFHIAGFGYIGHPQTIARFNAFISNG